MNTKIKKDNFGAVTSTKLKSGRSIISQFPSILRVSHWFQFHLRLKVGNLFATISPLFCFTSTSTSSSLVNYLSIYLKTIHTQLNQPFHLSTSYKITLKCLSLCRPISLADSRSLVLEKWNAAEIQLQNAKWMARAWNTI